nr:glycosyl hydrolase 108 family protein [uncultured Rhodopila sp.]
MSDAASDAFERAFAITIGHEGDAWDRTYGDPGNWTKGAVGCGELKGSKFGISAAVYSDLDIQHLTSDDAKAIYRRDYWARVQGEALPPPLAILVFDAAVNNGLSRAVRWLQAACEVDEDGVIGPSTLAAVKARRGVDICTEFMALRLTFMAGLPTWRLFGLGWARRLCALPWQSLTLTEAS